VTADVKTAHALSRTQEKRTQGWRFHSVTGKTVTLERHSRCFAAGRFLIVKGWSRQVDYIASH